MNIKFICKIILYFIYPLLTLGFFGIMHNTNYPMGIWNYLQITLLGWLIFFIFDKNKKIGFVTTLVVMFFYILLIIYKTTTLHELSYSTLRLNINDTFHGIISCYLWIILVMIVFAIIFSSGISYIYKKTKRNKYIAIVALLFILLPSFTNFIFKNYFVEFVKSAFWENETVTYYEEWLSKKIEKSQEMENDINTENIADELYLENIIFLHLESLNYELVNEKITPVLYNKTKDGVFFSKFYNNGVQTILAQENILCSLPNSTQLTLTMKEKSRDVYCLPKILRDAGYKNFFFKSYQNLDFAQTKKFMSDTGFDEAYASKDLNIPKDMYQKWGAREDAFYEAVFDKFQERKQQKNNFLYIAVSSTNHYPFSTNDLNINNEIKTPYKSGNNNFIEMISNTTYIQDYYLKTALERIDDMFPEKNYTLLIYGDHSWPLGQHGHIYNMNGAYEESFATSMLAIIGDEEKYKNIETEEIYSHMDILPSLMKLMKMQWPENEFSKSWFDDNLDIKKERGGKQIQVQPFGERSINIIDNKTYDKYMFYLEDEVLKKTNLLEDPEERKYTEIKEGVLDHFQKMLTE